MNRLELIESIHDLMLGVKKKEKEGIVNRLIDEKFTESESRLYDEWQNNNSLFGEQWHHFVRLSADFEEIQLMFRRTRSLVRKYRKSEKEYFTVNFGNQQCKLPDRISEIESLFSLYEEYFETHKKIIDKLSFQLIKKISQNNTIVGNINWDMTLRKSKTDFPLYFETNNFARNFTVPENLLLTLCAFWLDAISSSLMSFEFKDPLYAEELALVSEISNKTKQILRFFPFNEVTIKALELSKLDWDDIRIQELEEQARLRLRNGVIENRKYGDLLTWIKKIKSHNFPEIKKNTLTANFLLEATKHIDEIYEIWVFFEFIHYLSQYYNVQLILEDEQYCEFVIDEQKVRLYYEKSFEAGSKHAWVLKCKPDFTIIADEEIIGVFDAKNYRKSSFLGEENPLNKVLSYVTNLDTGFGAIFSPKDTSSEFCYPRELSSDNPKFHNRLKIANYSMNPYEINFNYDKISKTFEIILEEIKKRIRLSVILQPR